MTIEATTMVTVDVQTMQNVIYGSLIDLKQQKGI